MGVKIYGPTYVYGDNMSVIHNTSIDIAVEISQLSSFLDIPRQGHLVNTLHSMSYLKIKHNSRLVLDPSYPGIYMSEFKSNDNRAPFYGGVRRPNP